MYCMESDTKNSTRTVQPRKVYTRGYKVKLGKTIETWIQEESKFTSLAPEDTINALLLRAYENGITLIPQVPVN